MNALLHNSMLRLKQVSCPLNQTSRKEPIQIQKYGRKWYYEFILFSRYLNPNKWGNSKNSNDLK